MKRQIEMENTMLLAHREFVSNLEKALDMLDKDIQEASEMQNICTDEWCYSTDVVLDELHKLVFSISEPRWASDEDSSKIRKLRNRIKDLYVKFIETKKVAA